MSQTKRGSLIEAVIGTVIGFLITLALYPVLNIIFGVGMSGGQMTSYTAIFTVVSIGRGYVVRRFFNNLRKQGKL